MVKTVLVMVIIIKSICAVFNNGCVSPPFECPNENVTFWLYTRKNQDNPHQLFQKDVESIKNGPWVKDAPIKILIHGYTGYKDFSPNTEIRPAYMDTYDYNIISVDYEPIAREPCYPYAAKNTRLVGKCTAELIDTLVQEGFELKRFHVIGFSLGGHTAGFVGKYVTAGKLDRITGLDPALPLFVTTNKQEKLDSEDAKFVDVLHTNALNRGKLESCGDIDFYANGGLSQPGCTKEANRSKSSCDHARAPAYYAESITRNVGFYGTRCTTWITYLLGWCEAINSAEEVLFGEYVPYGSSGLYFFRTNSKPPYARGRNKNPPSSDNEV